MIENTGCAGVGSWWFVVRGFLGHEGDKHFLDHEEHEERLKNKFIVRRKMGTKKHKRNKEGKVI